MSFHFGISKSTATKLRKLPFLPRFAVTIEFLGQQYTLRSTPFLETILNVRELGFSLSNWRRISEQELAEIRLPVLARPVNVAKKGLAQVKSIKDKVSSKASPVRKAAVKKSASSSSRGTIETQ